jgi:predicted phosphatase
MDNQIPVQRPLLNCATQWAKNTGYVLVLVELALIGKNIDSIKAAGIPNYCEHHFP